MSELETTQIPRKLINTEREKHVRCLLDLITGNTIPLDLAAWWMSHVSKGASYLVGSGPGGIGKSTTMRSFLSVTPGKLPFAIALPGEINDLADKPRCSISLELSDHPPPGYLWDQELRDFLSLADAGHQLVSNVHADTLEQTHEQIVGTCHVPEYQFRQIRILGFIWLENHEPGASGRIKDDTSRRYMTTVHYSDGDSDHRTVYTNESGLATDAPCDPEYVASCREFLESCLNEGGLDLDGLRTRYLEWESAS